MRSLETMLYGCERVGQDGVLGALMGVVCELEERGGGEVRLGGFMKEFVRLERATRGVGLES